MNISKTLVFTVAINGYQWLYRDNLNTQKAYADKCGYDYLAVTQPTTSALGMECAWLKLALILSAFTRGYDSVLYVDADAKIADKTPDLGILLEPEKFLYMAKGYSGRVNSGVIFTLKNQDVINCFSKMIENCELPVPPEDDVGWGENGHVIHYTKNQAFLKIIDSHWNNNHQLDMDDFIRHFSCGPLRGHFKSALIDRIKFSLLKWACKPLQFYTKRNQCLNIMLKQLSRRVTARYPGFFADCEKSSN